MIRGHEPAIERAAEIIRELLSTKELHERFKQRGGESHPRPDSLYASEAECIAVELHMLDMNWLLNKPTCTERLEAITDVFLRKYDRDLRWCGIPLRVH